MGYWDCYIPTNNDTEIVHRFDTVMLFCNDTHHIQVVSINWDKLVIIELILYQLIRYLEVNETQSDQCPVGPVTQSDRTGASLGGGNVKCWGCFSSCGVGNLVFIDGNMTEEVYGDILEKNLFESIKKVEEWVMQQDNDPKHRAHIVTHWLKEKEIELIKCLRI